MKIKALISSLSLLVIFSFNACKTEKYPASYGLALYTVRDAVKADLENTIKEVGNMGYRYVEPAGYSLSSGTFYGKTPMEFKKLCEDNGLEAVSSHTGLMQYADSALNINITAVEKMLEDHKAAGILNIVNPSIPNEWRKEEVYFHMAAQVLNKVGKIAKDKGMNVLYHNHAWEFIPFGETTGFEILLTETDPDLVHFQMDCYWVVKAGVDPIELMRSNPGRFTIMHVKDMEDSEDKTFAEVGYGTIPYDEIIPLAKAEGIVYFLVEQDQSKRDPMESARMSAENLLKMK